MSAIDACDAAKSGVIITITAPDGREIIPRIHERHFSAAWDVPNFSTTATSVHGQSNRL
jgi:hypothetical protein